MKLLSYWEVKEEIDKKLQGVIADGSNLKKVLTEVRALIGIIENTYSYDYLNLERPSKVVLDSNNNTTSIGKNEYPFKRKLVGGTLIGLEGSYLAETIIRKFNLHEGDIVKVADTKNILKNMQKTDKRSGSHSKPDIDLFTYCEVKEDNGTIYCDTHFSDGLKLIKVDELPYKVVITDYEIDRFKISVGDFVDLTNLPKSFSSFRVIWKHDFSTYSTPKKSSEYKDGNEEKYENPAFFGIDFEGKTVHVIGLEPRKRHYKEAIEYCNGNFIHNSGDEDFTRISANISKSDIVLLLKDFLSHRIVIDSVQYCKDKDIPFKVVDGVGVQTVVFEARKLLLS